MNIEPSVVRTRDRLEADIKLEIFRYSLSARLMRSVPIFIAAVILGAVSILIPAVHLISTWAIPLLGTGIAIFIFRTNAKLGNVTGTCPSCSKSFSEAAGPYEEPMWIRCPSCNTPLQIILPD
jgi:hypothetical protein